MQDLPIPGWLFLWGAAVVLVLSFLALGALWKRPQLERRSAGRPLGLDRVLRASAIRILLGAISAGLLLLVFLTALIGEPSSAQNLAPTFVLVLFWLGLVPVQVLFGNVWRVLNPWRAVADGVAWLWRAAGQDWTSPLRYPERLGVWPAAFFLCCFAVYELVYTEPANPRSLALAVALYSYAMWFGMAAFGRREWDEAANGFTVYYGLFARIGPFAGREGEGRLVRRLPFTGLAGSDATPGLLAVVAVMLGSVAYDSVSRLSFWQDWNADLQRPYVLDDPGTADLIAMGLGLVGLLGCVLLVAVAFLGAARLAERTTGAGRSLVPDFVQSLVPIALVYAVAHYVTLLLVQGQYGWPLASDPFGYGWDLFGTVDYLPNIQPLAPNTVWYVQVAVLVAGHVAGLAIAHDRAVTVLPERDALRSQYPMLGLMVLYTVGGLWLLSQG